MFSLDLHTFDWIENLNGNYVCISSSTIDATVFQNKSGFWQVVISAFPFGRLVHKEKFNASQDAQERAESILRGASYDSIPMKPRPS